MTLKRACSLLTVKSFSEDERVITGIASTPSPDRDGDILEPEGAEFGSAIPFLWQHDHSRPVGQCTVRRVSEGLEITATLAKPVPDMPSQLAARLDEAWAAIKTGLVRGLSVGFRPHEYTLSGRRRTAFSALGADGGVCRHRARECGMHHPDH